MINGFRKEMMFFTRGGKLVIMLIVTFVLAGMSPVMFGMMKSMIKVMESMYDEETFKSMFAMFTGMGAAEVNMYTIEYVSEFGAIVFLFILKGAAGGEQQKRSVIIPQCSGLSAVSYALPKFLIYPLFIFVTAVLATFTGAGLALMIFGGTTDWQMITIAALCAGIYLAFFTCVQLCVGICTGRSGLAIVICILMQSFLPMILSLFRVDRFNPLALTGIAMSAAMGSGTGEEGGMLGMLQTASSTSDVSPLNVAVSVGTAVVISVLLYFITVFALHTKEVHNEGDEPVL